MKLRGTQTQRFVILLMLVLAGVLAFPSPAYTDEIDNLLASGDHAQGEVIAAFVDGGGSITKQSVTPYKVKPIMTVDASVVEAATSSESTMPMAPSSNDLMLSYGAPDSRSSKSFTLCAVTSGSLSTEELMRRLADAPNVAFVEPNYTFTLADPDTPDAAGSPASPNESDLLTTQADTNDMGDLTPLQWDN